MYAAIGGHLDILCRPLTMTKLPHVIMGNDRLTAINDTTQMDLQGEATSEFDGQRHISGTGKQAQFLRAAHASAGGKSFRCLSSTCERRGVRTSLIVLNLTPGNVVSTSRSDMMHVVIEHAIVNLKGKSVPSEPARCSGSPIPSFATAWNARRADTG